MIFKDINCNFYVQPQPLQYASDHDSVAIACEKNNIVTRAIYNLDKAGNANDVTLKFARESGGKEYPVIKLMPPVYPEETYTKDEMIKLIDNDKALFRIHPTSFASPMHTWLYDWMFDVLSESKTPLLVSLQELNLNDAAAVKEKYPELRLIITNTDQWLNRQYIGFCRHFKNVYFDTCNTIEYYGIENMVGLVGADKFIFGTYMPEKEPYDKTFQILFCELSDEEKEMIAHGNFERLVEVRA